MSTAPVNMKWISANKDFLYRVINMSLIVGLYFFTLYLKQVFVPVEKYEQDRKSWEQRYEKDTMEWRNTIKVFVDAARTVDNRLASIEIALKLQLNNNEEHQIMRNSIADHETRLRQVDKDMAISAKEIERINTIQRDLVIPAIQRKEMQPHE